MNRPVRPSRVDDPSEASARYRRIGTVHARRLEASVTWSTSAGDELRGEPGDWLVTAPDGTVHTVKDGLFRQTHRHLDGDRWERSGSVLARRITRETEVRTPEGAVQALPGDWVLEEPGGPVWPVQDGYFRQYYAPADGAD